MQFLVGSVRKYILFIFCILFFSSSYLTNSYFCDWLTYWNFDGVLCFSWNIIENIDNISDFNSSYQNYKPGYLWNNNNYELSSEMWSTLWFLWTKRTYKTPLSFHAPLWYMWFYSGQLLDIDNQIIENNFSIYPLVKYKWLGGGNGNSSNDNLCDYPIELSDIKIEVKNNGLYDYIHLSWKNPWNEKVKIVKISPKSDVFFIDKWVNFFDDNEILDWKKISYFIVVYNDCFDSWVYSNLLSITYNKNLESSKLYLSLTWNTLLLNIPESIKIDKNTRISLICNDSLNTYVDVFLIDNKYQLENNLFEKYFVCEASFYDLNGIYNRSEPFINIVLSDIYVKEEQALDYIFMWNSENYTYKYLYLNVSKIRKEDYMTYWKSALYFFNIFGWIYLWNEELAFDYLKQYWYIEKNKIISDKILTRDFIDLLSFIKNDLSNFQENINTYIDRNFWDKKYNLGLNEINNNLEYVNLLNLYYVNNKKSFYALSDCISWVECTDLDLLKLNLSSDLKQESDLYTYKDYMKLLYSNYWKDAYNIWKYSLSDYNKFVDILIESISYWNDFYNQKITYDSFRNLQKEILLHRNLQKNISYLVTNHLDKILSIYKTSSKDEMIWILRDYLNK